MATSNSRIAVSISLALAAAAFGSPASAQTEPENSTAVPSPPAEEGCYKFSNEEWLTVACDSAAYIERNIPHPQTLAGIGEVKVKSRTAPPFKSSTIAVSLSELGAEEDINPKSGLPEAGSDAYSIQVNVFFTGNNGAPDGLQFTNQAKPFTPSPGWYMNNVCVWQVDIATQKYSPTCMSLPFTAIWNEVKGVDLGAGYLATIAYYEGAATVAVVTPDKYELTKGERWNNVSGGLIGLGNGSEAHFAGKGGLSRTYITAATCPEDDPQGSVTTSKACTTADKLDSQAVPIVSPSAATEGAYTVETTNLEPVTGNPISKLPTVTFPNDWAAEMKYASTPTGKCSGSTSPPLCK
jgi:hypothetical protein